MTPKTVAIIGAGRVGSSVGCLLRKAGYTVTAVAARSMASAEKAADFIGSGEPTTDVVKAASKADIVFITTPDGAIKNVCDKIAAEGGLKAGSLVVHMFGAQSLDILAGARSSGSYRAVIHPLQSVPSPAQGIKNLPGSYFRIEADPEAPGSRPGPGQGARRRRAGDVEMESGQGLRRTVSCRSDSGFKLFCSARRLWTEILSGAGCGKTRNASGPAPAHQGDAS